METVRNTTKPKVKISNSFFYGKEKVKSIRGFMSKNKIGAYLIPRTDCFQGEFISENDNRLKWLTNFSGSAGLCIVTMKSIALFVDGRYTTQVKIQTSEKIFDHENLNYSDIEKWIKLNLKETSEIGFCPMTISLEKFNSFKNFQLITLIIPKHPCHCFFL